MTKTAEKPFKCPECSYVAKTQGAVTAHIGKNHADDPAIKLRSEFGALAPRPGGLGTVQQKLVASPSGVPSIDYAIGIGGVPKGRIIEIFGPARTGKSLVALTFSAYVQQNGGRAGFMDAERALQPTFAELVPGLDVDALEYGQAHGGEEAFEQSKRWIQTGGYDIWTIDSLKACVPEAMVDVPIGAPAARAALARLLSDALPVMDMVTSDSGCTLIMVNHQKENPGVKFGRTWYTPGGSAPEYHCAVRLQVWAGQSHFNQKGIQFGHRVKVKVQKSKVAMPFNTAEFDLFYGSGAIKDTGREVKSGVDIASSWLDILVQEALVAKTSGGNYVSLPNGEKLGTEKEFIEALWDPKNEWVKKARAIVYPAAFAK